jgi:hypothetical protein
MPLERCEAARIADALQRAFCMAPADLGRAAVRTAARPARHVRAKAASRRKRPGTARA